jgi:phosphate transport system substrate-binding protein
VGLIFTAVPFAGLAFFVVAVVMATRSEGRRRGVWGTVAAVVGFVGLWIGFGLYNWVAWDAQLPVWAMAVFSLGALAVALLAAWRPFRPTARYVAMSLIGAVVALSLGGAVSRSLYESSLLVVGDAELQVDIALYEPFAEDTLAASLDEPSTLRLEGELPLLDGATALYPLYASFARAVYPERAYYPYAEPGPAIRQGDPEAEMAQSEVICSTTPYAFDNLIAGHVDVAFLMDVSELQREQAEAAGVDLELTPIGREAFVFFVSQDNPVSNLTAEQVRQIYSGEIANWREVGGPNRAITAYQRDEGSGSQTALLQVMGERPLAPAPQDESALGSMGGMAATVLDYKNSPGAIGFSFRYYLDTMIQSDQLKVLSIDGVAPTAESIAAGDYPFSVTFHAVTASHPDWAEAESRGADSRGADARDQSRQPAEPERPRANSTRRLIEWITSPQGQELVKKVGYVPLDG